MATEMVRLPLPEPDDAHPLDWYPGDEPESRTVAEVKRWVNETLTRSGDVVKLQGGAGTVGSRPAPYTTSPAREIVMPLQRTMRQPRVYFFHCLDCHLVKIGYSRDYLRRRVQLELSTEHVLDILGTHAGNRGVEARVHALFAADRVEGEWFRYSDAIRAYVDEHTDPPRSQWPPFSQDGRRGVYRKVRP